ncbi:hypothetical protein [Candidatus Nitrosocosmicus sp. SS]|jgi:hypothetical protein|uniref:hypothetical protein n=1 Tax=Candidatus Nitrosocosmicus agrestis TaxID=2563600 RepID=UPI00122E61F8|nr:hypothetical protein [Candidatus Nitrosocosmicus sp. SS]KAA2283536.1 hypothetical protein F1Z66_01245 [Candidatus Nitrosocosmicus sp. SS]KAF0869617.1 hypothetical protein E5N71_03775 [Candidatus Nitrosocosmicus sp. SS]
MKKKSKIRILKDNQKNDDNYTFVSDDTGISSTQNAKASPNDEVVGDDTGAIDVNNLNEIRKKKKVLTNEDIRKASKGLKFNNPSQRNHSSIYE